MVQKLPEHIKPDNVRHIANTLTLLRKGSRRTLASANSMTPGRWIAGIGSEGSVLRKAFRDRCRPGAVLQFEC